jgi:branched-chain amino acid transport system permease protein
MDATLTPVVLQSLGEVNLNLLLLQLLNGIALGLLYVLVASGLTVIFGVTGILNFAHGAMYMLGAYLALLVASVVGGAVGGGFWVALVVAPLLVAGLGIVVERTTIHHLYDRDISYQMLLTFGITLMITDGVKFVFQGQRSLAPPPQFTGATQLGPVVYPTYRLFVIGAAIALTLLLYLVFRYTDFGLIARAGSQSHRTVRILGVDISRYFTGVFGLGSLLAGVAGVLAAPFVGITANMGNEIVLVAFIVVILGGLGSFKGSVVAGLLIGLTQTLGQTYLPALTGYWIYIALVGTLVVRPQGLFGEYNVREELAKVVYDRNVSPISPFDRRALIVVAALAAAPLVALATGVTYYVDILTLMLIWGLLALSLDLVLGYLGLLSFGHAAFIAVGAYATGITLISVSRSFLLAFVVAVALTTVVAWLIGALSIRFHGVFFAMITLAIAQMIYVLATNLTDITGGTNGLGGIPVPTLLGVPLDGTVLYYYVVGVVVFGCYAVAYRLLQSPFGRAMVAIREGERRMSFLGYDTNKYKRRAFAVSGAIGGVAGVLFASYQYFVGPSVAFWTSSGDALFGVILGGMGTLYGPLLGGAAFVGIRQVLSSYVDEWRFVVGLLLVLIVMFAPRGLVSLYWDLKARVPSLGGGGSPTSTAADEVASVSPSASGSGPDAGPGKPDPNTGTGTGSRSGSAGGSSGPDEEVD